MAAPMLASRLTLSLLKSVKSIQLCRHVIVPPDIYGGDLRPRLFPLERKHRKEHVPEDMKSLTEILKEKESQNPESHIRPLNIGTSHKPEKLEPIKRSAESRLALEHAARHRTLQVPLDEVRDSWLTELAPVHKKELAEHYGIYSHLFGPGAFFYPVIDLRVTYDFEDDLVTPVYFGNVIPPSEVASVPDVTYQAEDDSLWTLILTNPDGHLTNQDVEYLHWMVGNIPGNQISEGKELCSYLQPFPPRGTGFHRHVFLLFKQEKKLDYSAVQRPANCCSLRERTFSTLDFYQQFEADLTPMGLSFFQSEWDKSVKHIYHSILDMREPSFEYDHEPRYHPPLQTYPKREPFDRYYDRYRDKKDIAEDVLKKKMDMISPFKEYTPPLKYPLVHLAVSNKPTWLRKREELMHRRREQFQDLPK